MRTCVGCREVVPKKELIRIVRTPEGQVVVDPSGKANGRGAYTHPNLTCFGEAIKSKRLAKSLEVQLSQEDIKRLEASVLQVLVLREQAVTK
jgi:hypothetical protein